MNAKQEQNEALEQLLASFKGGKKMLEAYERSNHDAEAAIRKQMHAQLYEGFALIKPIPKNFDPDNTGFNPFGGASRERNWFEHNVHFGYDLREAYGQ
jgi:hypothetical protein